MATRHCYAVLAVISAAAMTTAAAALAEPGSAPEQDIKAETTSAMETARDRYRKGAAAYNEGRFKDAIDLFLDADKLAPSAALSFNIARAYDKLGDPSGALRWYRDYLRRAESPEDAEQVEAMIAGFEQRLVEKGVQQVTVFSEPSGSTVLIDDRPVGVTPWTGDLPPGPHRVSARLRGYDDADRDIELPTDHAIDVTLSLSPATEPEPIPPGAPPPALESKPPQSAPTDTSDSGSLGTWGWVTLGAGAGALGGAIVFEIMRRGAESGAENARTQIEFADRVDSMESRRTTARVLAGVGGALALTGGVLLAIDTGVFSGSDTTQVGFGCSGALCGAHAHGTF